MPSLIELKISTLHFHQIVDLFRVYMVLKTDEYCVYKHRERNFIFYSDSEQKDIRCIDVATLTLIDKYHLFLFLSPSFSLTYFQSKFADEKQISEFSFPVSVSFNQVMKLFFNLTSLDKIPDASLIPPVFKNLSSKEPFRGKVFYNPAADSFSMPLFSEGTITDFVDFNFHFFRSRYGIHRGLCEIAPLAADFSGERCLIIPSNPLSLFTYFYCTGFEEGQSGMIMSPAADEASLHDLFTYYVSNNYSKIIFVYENTPDTLPDHLFFILKIISHFITIQTKYAPVISFSNGNVNISFLRCAETFRIDTASNLCRRMNDKLMKNLSDLFGDIFDEKSIGSDFSFSMSLDAYAKTEKRRDKIQSVEPGTKSPGSRVFYPMLTFPKKAEFLEVCVKQWIEYFMLENFSLQGFDSKTFFSESDLSPQ